MRRHEIHWRTDRDCWICVNCGQLWEKYPIGLQQEGECQP